MWTRGHRSAQVERITTASTRGEGEGCSLTPVLAQKKCFVTADVCYAHPWQCNARLCHVARGFCVTAVRRSVCPHCAPSLADACDADRRHTHRGVEGCCRRRNALGCSADRAPQEGPRSLDVRRRTERLEATAA